MDKLTQAGVELTLAKAYSNNVINRLQDAITSAGPVAALVIIPMIARAAALQADISALIDALNATE